LGGSAVLDAEGEKTQCGEQGGAMTMQQRTPQDAAGFIAGFWPAAKARDARAIGSGGLPEFGGAVQDGGGQTGL
jgi:hypothetical protein